MRPNERDEEKLEDLLCMDLKHKDTQFLETLPEFAEWSEGQCQWFDDLVRRYLHE